MRLFALLRSWFRTLLLRSDAESQMDTELRFHLDSRAEDLIRSGIPREEAFRRARIEFGGVENFKEECREARGSNFFESLFQDIRFGFRMLRKSPGFTAVAVLTLALGIGANTAIFSVVNSLLLRPPAVEEPSTLLEVWQHHRDRGNGIGSHLQLSYPDYEYYRDHNRSFADMACFTGEANHLIWNRDGEGETIQGSLVSANFFSLLGVKPVLGRGFLPDEDSASSPAQVVMLSHAFWKQRLASDPAILQRTLTLNGRDFAVVGVLPQGFSGLFIGSASDVWLPMTMHAAVDPRSDNAERHMHWLLGVGRLKPDTTPDMAKADFAILARQLSDAYPESNKDLDAGVVPVELVPAPFRGVFGGISVGLMTVVGLVLLIACSNIANLLLAKAASRRREMAVRAALGAARPRLVRQALTESLLIAAIAGFLGLFLAYWAMPFLYSLKPASLPLALNLSLDIRVLLFTSVTSLVIGVAFGLVPALHGSRLDLVNGLKEGLHQAGSGKSRLRNALVITQITACMVLLVGAGLCLRSLFNARSIDPGFDTRNAFAASLNVQTFGYSEPRGKIFYRSLLEQVRALPGVQSVSLADHLPLGQFIRMEGADIDGEQNRPANPGEFAHVIEDAIVAPGYFSAMGIPLLRGREFMPQDSDSAPAVVIINQVMAERFWPNRDALGSFLTIGGPGGARTRAQVVGVVKSGKYQTLGEEPKPFFYRSVLQAYEPNVTIIVRTRGESSAFIPAVRGIVRQLDPRMTLVGAETLQQHMQLPLFPAQAAGLLLGAFGFLALLLAILGLYGVVSYSVSQRTHEIGVRMALGASRHDAMRLVVWQGLRLTWIGLGLGLLGAFAVTRMLSSLLYGISPTDPLSFLGVSALLTAVALFATYIPARRATRVDPLVALRYE